MKLLLSTSDDDDHRWGNPQGDYIYTTGQIKPMTCKEALNPNDSSVKQPESQWTHYKCSTHFFANIVWICYK